MRECNNNKENMEEKKRQSRKIESVAVREGLYLKPYSKGKRIKKRKN